MERATSAFTAALGSRARPDVAETEIAQDAGRALGIDIVPAEIRGAEDLAPTFASLASGSFDGIVVAAGVLTDSHARRIAELAARARVPTMYGAPESSSTVAWFRTQPASPGTNGAPQHMSIGFFAEPGPLNCRSSKSSPYELVINRKTAAALGLALAPALVLQARVVE